MFRRGVFCKVWVYALGALAMISAQMARAQDPAKVAPDNYKVAFENDNVRVCNVTVPAGGKVAMHSHPDHVAYAINGGKIKFTYADGKSKDVEMKTGEAMFIKAEAHSGENIGKDEIKLVVFELKKPAGSAAKAPAGDDQMKAAADSSKVVLDNDRVRLIEAKLKAGGKMAKHTHPSYVAYALNDAKVKMTVGDKTEEKSLKSGQAMWGEPTTHSVENTSGGEARMLVLEIKQ